MTSEQQQVLKALYEREERELTSNQFDVWTTAEELAQSLFGVKYTSVDLESVQTCLQALWVSRKVLQVPCEVVEPQSVQTVSLDGDEGWGAGETQLLSETPDCRFDGDPPTALESVAIFDPETAVRYRSRVAEIARLLASNYQRFNMAPATGLLRYVRRPQLRPLRDVKVSELQQQLRDEISSGCITADHIDGGTRNYPLRSDTNREHLTRAVSAVLSGFVEQVGASSDTSLATFQVKSIRATVASLYSNGFRDDVSAHVITAGVGSGKTYAFQLGALIHVAYQAVTGNRKLQVLFIYPRVVLAANQFQDLAELLTRVSEKLGLPHPLQPSVLDAGQQLKSQMQVGAEETGGLFQAIRRAYQGDRQILISNLDTLANRIAHPEAFRGLTGSLDLIVFDEIHILRGLYGAHAKMLLARLLQMRAFCRLRTRFPQDRFERLLERRASESDPYLIGASATIAEPRRHTARVLGLSGPRGVLHIPSEDSQETGWVHNLFLRQRPEVSSMSAVTNATSCLVHNRRNGLFREYYQHRENPSPLGMHQLANPVQPAEDIVMRDTAMIHKTVAFCDSLDGVGRWANLVADNEGMKSDRSSPQPLPQSLPYFLRFQEPLWRTILHLGFGKTIPVWQQRTRQHYGRLCYSCKQGCKQRIQRIPDGLTPPRAEKVQELWDFEGDTGNDFLTQLGVADNQKQSDAFAPLRDASRQDTIGNLDECGFFQSGLCWWWSMDHAGNNRPSQIRPESPMAGFKQPSPNEQRLYKFINGVRQRWFTSASDFGAFNSINDLYRAKAKEIYRPSAGYNAAAEDNTALVIGSPKIEVGIDLDHACDGITFRAMRDPSSVQQKVGRVGRESGADSLIVHLVTENPRDHYYFRNPHIVLDPNYLQAIPLHENNRIVARNHFFMAVVDFIALQGISPTGSGIPDEGDRFWLLNDFANESRPRCGTFHGWERKLEAVYSFLFGDHPHQSRNLENLRRYLSLLGARPEELQGDVDFANVSPANACPAPRGALDVWQYDFGDQLLQTPLATESGRPLTLGMVAAYPQSPGGVVGIGELPRHQALLRQLRSQNPFVDRSYLNGLLQLSVFRRGVPAQGVEGNQPYLWTPNLFEAVGNESVSILEERQNADGTRWLKPVGQESLGLVLALLVPGTFTYRYGDRAKKVAVGAYAASERPRSLGARLEGVVLDVHNTEFFDIAPNCPPLQPNELPREFEGTGNPVQVFSPRQVHLVWSPDDPQVAARGVTIDGDHEQFGAAAVASLPTPPRTFPLRWYRVASSDSAAEIPCRIRQGYSRQNPSELARLPSPFVGRLFSEVQYDPNLEVTEYVWGVDQQFTTRSVDPARIVYREGGEDPTMEAVALGRHFRTSAIRFALETDSESFFNGLIRKVFDQQDSAVHQSLLLQILNAFLAENARNLLTGGAPWEEPSRPSIFIVRNLRTIILFRCLEHWIAQANDDQPPQLSLEDLVGCFTPGHTLSLDQATFNAVCGRIALAQNPAQAQQRADTLSGTFANYAEAVERRGNLNAEFFQSQASEILLNTLGIALHNAALQLTGAENSDFAYFYRRQEDHAELFLFDTDEFGNGTAEVIQHHFFISQVERVLYDRRVALGGSPDPLPTRDFIQCFLDQLQECESSQAAHLAFHNLSAASGSLQDLDLPRSGERQVAGPVFDLMRNRLHCRSFDHTAVLQACPEFLSHLDQIAGFEDVNLVPTPVLPTFQALESSVGYCLSGCVDCVVSPEQNLHGVLTAKETVNKLLLDAFYRIVVCEADSPQSSLLYPGTGVSRTVLFSDAAATTASANAQPLNTDPITVTLDENPESPLSITPAASLEAYERVFRPGLDPAPMPEDRSRIRMGF